MPPYRQTEADRTYERLLHEIMRLGPEAKSLALDLDGVVVDRLCEAGRRSDVLDAVISLVLSPTSSPCSR